MNRSDSRRNKTRLITASRSALNPTDGKIQLCRGNAFRGLLMKDHGRKIVLQKKILLYRIGHLVYRIGNSIDKTWEYSILTPHAFSSLEKAGFLFAVLIYEVKSIFRALSFVHENHKYHVQNISMTLNKKSTPMEEKTWLPSL